MDLQTPVGPDIPVAATRQFAIDQIEAKLSAEPGLVASFWEELNGSAPPVPPDITVFYCFLKVEEAGFTLLEFVSGQTLQELCTNADPASCEKVIPLFSRLLDAYEGNVEGTANSHPRVKLNKSTKIQLTGFGIARAGASMTPKLHGSLLVRPDGSWCDEILSEEGVRSAVYPVLVAVYKELLGGLPKGTPLAPAPISSFSNRSLMQRTTPSLANRAIPYLTAVGACALLLMGLFGAGHILAKRARSGAGGGLHLPPSLTVPVAEAAPPVEINPEAVTPAAPVKETLVINNAGLSRGARLIRQTGPKYPAAARQKGISGVVKLEVTVAEDGSVWAANVLSGDPLLAQGTAEAVKKWVYQPALVNGKPTSSTIEVEIKFDLDHPQ